jgi:hypothetical protein
MPRFQSPNFEANMALLPRYRALAAAAGYTPAQLALVWLLQQGEHVHPIPGTTSLVHLEENVAAATLAPNTPILREVGELINEETVTGPRYAAATLAEIDTEVFA